MNIRIRQLSTVEFVRAAPELVSIYLAAMHYDPDLLETRVEAWRHHTLLPNFRAVVALDGDSLVGVAYGHACAPMSWWHSQVQRGLYASGTYTAENRRIMSNYFELSEIHVQPGAQGAHIGERLLRELVAPVRQPVVLLSTPEVVGENNGAFGLYRKLGFQDLLRNHLFVGDARPFAILAAALPLDQRCVDKL